MTFAIGVSRSARRTWTWKFRQKQKCDGGIGLRIQIDEEGTLVAICDGRREIDRRGGFSDPPFWLAIVMMAHQCASVRADRNPFCVPATGFQM
jgi:hypothetical protein